METTTAISKKGTLEHPHQVVRRGLEEYTRIAEDNNQLHEELSRERSTSALLETQLRDKEGLLVELRAQKAAEILVLNARCADLTRQHDRMMERLAQLHAAIRAIGFVVDGVRHEAGIAINEPENESGHTAQQS